MTNNPERPGGADAPLTTGETITGLDAFTQGLKHLFDETLAEPIPQSFLDLLDRLDDKWEG